MKEQVALKPPMGWNSWDCYGTTVTEDQVKANARAMKEHLAPFGWEYVVVDIQWYEPNSQGHSYREGAELTMDGFGRLQPAPNKFPSSQKGKGFKPLADYIHSLGLKFGLHIVRGISRQAVAHNTPLFNSPRKASEIADTSSTCPWNPDMYGVDMKKPGAQDYYDSLFRMFADWGVDFVKADDMLSPVYHADEIEAMARAIENSGRPMVFSLSPGGAAVVLPALTPHLSLHANMWRVSDDFWDEWKLLKEQFTLAKRWQEEALPGHWPDLDMLPLGRLVIWKEAVEGKKEWKNRLTRDEQRTLMTLWAIFRSPLMMGGDLPSLDDFTLSLLTNREVLKLNQDSEWNRELFQKGDLVAWAAKNSGSKDLYLAVFNLGEVSMKVDLPLKELEVKGSPVIEDLWAGMPVKGRGVELAPHASGLYRIKI